MLVGETSMLIFSFGMPGISTFISYLFSRVLCKIPTVKFPQSFYTAPTTTHIQVSLLLIRFFLLKRINHTTFKVSLWVLSVQSLLKDLASIRYLRCSRYRVIPLKPRTIKTTISYPPSHTIFIYMPNKPTIFPHMKFISKTFFSCLYRAFHKLPAILWNICLRLNHSTIRMNRVLCYNCFLKYLEVISN